MIITRRWPACRAELGRVKGLRGYHDLSRYPEGGRIPGVVIVRFDAPLTDIDTTAIDELVELDDYLASHGITLVLAEMKDPVVDVLRAYGLAERFSPDRFAPTVGAAVDDVTGALRGDLDGTKLEENRED